MFPSFPLSLPPSLLPSFPTGSEIALKVFSNRAACYKQLSNFDGVISDCTSVLEVKPDDVKSLLRRAQAFEAVERYKMALQDVRALLALPTEVVGPSNTSVGRSRGREAKEGCVPVFFLHSSVIFLMLIILLSPLHFLKQIANGLQHRLNRVIQKLRDV